MDDTSGIHIYVHSGAHDLFRSSKTDARCHHWSISENKNNKVVKYCTSYCESSNFCTLFRMEMCDFQIKTWMNLNYTFTYIDYLYFSKDRKVNIFIIFPKSGKLYILYRIRPLLFDALKTLMSFKKNKRADFKNLSMTN